MSLPSAVMSNNMDEEDVVDESQDAEWKNMFHVVSNATKNVDEKKTIKRAFDVEDLLRLVSQEALSSSLEDTSFSWMSDHLPSAIAGAIQRRTSHATSVALYYMQSNRWTNPFDSSRVDEFVTKDNAKLLMLCFGHPPSYRTL